MDKHACLTLKANRPHWNVVEGDIAQIDFASFENQVDIISGGFPCQAFSYAGKRMGFEDTRGTLFYEFARAVKECKPKLFVAENVRGLERHDNGKTLETILAVFGDLGYKVLEPRVLKAVEHNVPQKRERLIIVGIRLDLAEKASFEWPTISPKLLTMRDALKKGELFDCDTPHSEGQKYPAKKAEIMKLVPPGGYWRNLPLDIQKSYMGKSFYLGGGKTGIARRMAWSEPCLTLTCAPAQKQTERCHPEETRPLTIREYARIQTFPDDWQFCGAIASQYKQIGNAVPVNLAKAIGESLIQWLDSIS